MVWSSRKQHGGNMGFFGIGTGEIILVLVVALIVVGPGKLPDLAKILGRGFSEFKKAADDLRDSMNTEIHVEREKRKLLDIQPQPKETDPAQIDIKATPGDQIPEKRGNGTEDEETEDIV
jgi:Tat protein translocase TatB subunit